MPHLRNGKPVGGSLSTIIGGYKSGVTRQAHSLSLLSHRILWQSRFYDHIIRDDLAMYFIRQYIELNPLFWQYDIKDPNGTSTTHEQFQNLLTRQHGITGDALVMIMSSRKAQRLKIR